jgi:hypothetical protein
MAFNGGGAALLWQIISTGLRSAVGLVCQVPIDVDICDYREPFLRECCGVILLCFVKEQHQGVQAVWVAVHDVLYLPVFWGNQGRIICYVTLDNW